MKLIPQTVGALLLAAFVAAAWDFLSFVDRADNAVAQSSEGPADAVAVLTGASDERLLRGVQLANSLGAPLLISGVHVDATPADIAEIVGVTEPEIACCVTLGRAAATTEGNGEEVAEWARRFGFHTILVVTSEYHMERAILELSRAMPEAEFLPHAIATMSVPPSQWHSNPGAAKRMLSEWVKIRVARLRTAGATPEQTDDDQT